MEPDENVNPYDIVASPLLQAVRTRVTPESSDNEDLDKLEELGGAYQSDDEWGPLSFHNWTGSGRINSLRQHKRSADKYLLKSMGPNDFAAHKIPDQPTYFGSDNIWTSSLNLSLDESALKEIHERIRKGKQRGHRRQTLPLTLGHGLNRTVVITCPDSGADDNVMTLQQACDLGLLINYDLKVPKSFSLANGKTINAIGTVTVPCEFVTGSGPRTSTTWPFYVFNKLAAQVIVGIEFLQSSQTLTKYRDRLVEEVIPLFQSLRINSIGYPKRSVVCQLGTHVGTAMADTGSDIDLVSKQYAMSRGHRLGGETELIMFADGSVGETLGCFKENFSIGSLPNSLGTYYRNHSNIERLEFHVFDNLTTDIIIGMYTVDDLRVFQRHEDCFVPSVPNGLSDLNVIRHVKGASTVRNCLNRLLRRKQEIMDSTVDPSNIAIQRENYRHEKALERIAKIKDFDEKTRALAEEEVRYGAFELPTQRTSSTRSTVVGAGTPAENSSNATDMDSIAATSLTYSTQHSVDGPRDNTSSRSASPALTPRPHLSDATIAPPGSGSYSCEYPGCTAAPFQTQYLLNSHANVHSTSRPHYCPVAGCPRAEGGRGFKRHNEMIRHGLVHDQPGYICPFCPDREHKYPRPDNLQRHVRVHHTDKSREDPALRDVLAQRPELIGANRGRRRRLGL